MPRRGESQAVARMRAGVASPQRRRAARAVVRRRPTRAERADPFLLYERSVQRPDDDVAFFAETFRRLRGREAKVLREDFCGTAKLSLAWCDGAPGRRAVGVDLDAATLEWARRHNVAPHARRLRGRLELVQGDVVEVRTRTADVICAMNFSFCVFKERAQLARYLAAARDGLAADGLLFLELYGGTGAIEPVKEERDCGGFTYVWEQKRYDPITNDTLCHIHFEFPDGSRLERAFTYDWRLWTIPELRDLLLEAGFSRVRVFWAALDEDEANADDDMVYGNGDYVEVSEAEQQYSWLVYVVGEK
ncbi:MAG: class I SAM-dependent methyltransferase [Thermodesulfobacteriota bacterium]